MKCCRHWPISLFTKKYEDKSNPDPKVLNLVDMDFLNASSDFGNAHFVVLSKYIKHTKISYEEIYDDRFFHSYFYSYREE